MFGLVHTLFFISTQFHIILVSISDLIKVKISRIKVDLKMIASGSLVWVFYPRR